MIINKINFYNSNTRINKRNKNLNNNASSQNHSIKENNISFKGTKGALIGTIIAYSFATIINSTILPLALLCAGLGTVVGHHIEESLNDNNKNDNDNFYHR